MELAGKAEKLAKRLLPLDEEAAERHAFDAFLGELDWTLAAEVQKLGTERWRKSLPLLEGLKNPRRADRLRNGATGQYNAGPDPDPQKGSQRGS